VCQFVVCRFQQGTGPNGGHFEYLTKMDCRLNSLILKKQVIALRIYFQRQYL